MECDQAGRQEENFSGGLRLQYGKSWHILVVSGDRGIWIKKLQSELGDGPSRVLNTIWAL